MKELFFKYKGNCSFNFTIKQKLQHCFVTAYQILCEQVCICVHANMKRVAPRLLRLIASVQNILLKFITYDHTKAYKLSLVLFPSAHGE